MKFENIYRTQSSAILFAVLLLFLPSCLQGTPETIVITATFAPETATEAAQIYLERTLAAQSTQIISPPEATTASIANPTPVPNANTATGAEEYIVQAGDTLSAIAARFGASTDTLQAINQLDNPDHLFVGQVLQLPQAPTEMGSNFKVLPDSRLVRAPGSISFNIYDFINQQTGFIRTATDEIDDISFTAAQIVERVSLEYSVDARVLLAFLELKGNWLSRSDIDEYAQNYPLHAPASLFGFDRRGLYRQLAWGAEQLNAGYYGWKLRGLSAIEFQDGLRIRIAPDLNAGTVGVQYALSRFNEHLPWRNEVSADGLYRIYLHYFGDPFANSIEPLIPDSLVQPTLTLPFQQGETWFYTGGPHGGYGSASAWSSIDFVPPDEREDGSPLCYISEYFVTAVASGVIARSGDGTVILDLDGDGDESTGWTIVYLHVGSPDRIAQGTAVTAGDRIGRPSCEGGVSSAAHLHIGRRYNGEWMPTTCQGCSTALTTPPFVMSGWEAVGIVNQEYQGYLISGAERRIAEQSRLIAENRVSW